MSDRRPLIVCYDPKELDALLGLLDERSRIDLPGSRFPLVEGTIDGKPVCLMRIPFGDDPALLTSVVRAVLKAAAPSSLVSVGTAMACGHGLEVGDVVVSDGASHHGRSVAFGGRLNEDFLKSAPHDLVVKRGHSVTARAFVAGTAERDRLLAESPGADTIEMEDFHVASVAAEHAVGFVSIRAITDRGDFSDHMARRDLAAARAVRVLRRGLRQKRIASALAVLDNPPTADLPWRMVLTSTELPLDIPDAVRVARRVAAAFDLAALLKKGARVDVWLSDSPALPLHLSSPSGQAKAFQLPGRWAAVLDPIAGWAGITVRETMARAGDLAPAGLAELAAATELSPVGVSKPDERKYSMKTGKVFHIQGLNSISAEPEEGLLAATTICEFAANGLEVGDSSRGKTWIYRSAHASDESYFHPPYLVPARVADEIPDGTLLIATGLGPAIDPAAPGGRLADALLLGDEQGGRLVQYLDDLSGGPFSPDDVFRYEGVAQKLDARTVALSRLDRRPLLTTDGMNSLRYDPTTLRGVYSSTYDEFLRTYFSVSRRQKPARASHLLLTSRGCGYHCSFCCSGGMQPFSALAIDVLVRMLRDVLELDGLEPGDHADIYFLDSYFNRNPERIVQLADRLEAEGLLPRFEFYVRHNGLQAFLSHRATASTAPVVHTRLIEAYKRLGIDEVVMGVDAYTDESIRMLKTSFNQLVAKGEEARPIYTFADIGAVLTALEAAGLKSRCFLLVYNPFASDGDRIATFYNLIDLAMRVPNFALDSSSSDRVNELKPFPGAPLTRLAEQVPGLIRGDRFEYSTSLGRLEDLFDLGMFAGRRASVEEMSVFLSSARAARARLGRRLLEALEETSGPAARAELSTAARPFVEGEDRLAAAFDASGDPEVSALVDTVRRACAAPEAHPPPRAPLFYKMLHGRRRPKHSAPRSGSEVVK